MRNDIFYFINQNYWKIFDKYLNIHFYLSKVKLYINFINFIIKSWMENKFIYQRYNW